jgi:ABC-type glutathione transport system ATPase component
MKAAEDAPNLLEVRGLNVRFVGDEGIVTAVDDVSFTLSLGQTLCLLGESGCGKTVTMRSLMRLLPATARLSGSVRLDGLE